MLTIARNLRMERDRDEQIQKQKQEQRSLVGGHLSTANYQLYCQFWFN